MRKKKNAKKSASKKTSSKRSRDGAADALFEPCSQIPVGREIKPDREKRITFARRTPSIWSDPSRTQISGGVIGQMLKDAEQHLARLDIEARRIEEEKSETIIKIEFLADALIQIEKLRMAKLEEADQSQS